MAVAEVLATLIKQTRRKVLEISGDGVYDTRDCHKAIHIKRAVAWQSVKSKKLQRKSWRNLCDDQSIEQSLITLQIICIICRHNEVYHSTYNDLLSYFKMHGEATYQNRYLSKIKFY